MTMSISLSQLLYSFLKKLTKSDLLTYIVKLMKGHHQQPIFRFRTYSPLALKELQYGEIFFASKDELNDPYDTKSSALFKGDSAVYKRLIQFILTDKHLGFTFLKEKVDNINTKLIADYLAEEDLLYDDLIRRISSPEFEDIVVKAFCVEESIVLSLAFIKRLKYFVHKNVGGHCYIASFSRKNNDPVMWSHYAQNHKGFCLCFSFEDDKILGKYSSSFHQTEYQIKNVSYKNANNITNGFYCFPGAIYGHPVHEDYRKKHWEDKEAALLTKFSSWQYEDGVRIVHDDWLTDNASENGVIKKPAWERVFYYEQTQLTGVIFGSRMESSQRNEIRSLVMGLRHNLIGPIGYLPIFIFYESSESAMKYEMNIKQLDGLDAFNHLFDIELLEVKQAEYNKLKAR